MLKPRLPLLLAGLLLSLCPLPAAEEAPPSPSPIQATGQSVIPANWAGNLVAGSPKSSTFGSVEAGSTPTAIRIITRAQPENVFNLQAYLGNQIVLHKGDTLMIRFAGRSLKADVNTGVTKLKIGFSKNSPDWDSSYTGEVGLGAAWQRYDIPFTCKNDFAPHEAKFFIMYGYPAQQAEIADLQVISFGPGVPVASLPRTKRFTDPFTPEQLATEVARIAAMRNELAAVTDPAPAHGRTLNVSTAGSAKGDGSAAKPFATIPQALAIVQPGDTILVGAGEYLYRGGVSIRTSGRPDAWIKIHAAPGARPKIISSGWVGFGMTKGICYIEIKGFELAWVPDPAVKKQVDGVGLAPSYACHHLRFLDNVIHGFGTGGICSLDCDYVHVEGNLIYDTSKTSPYGGSAISLCRAFNLDEYPGYHNVVRGNICHDNELLVSVLVASGGNGKAITDGNGIIIDVFNRSRAHPMIPHTQDRDGPLEPYRGRTLVENNLIYDNGGRGVHVFRSSNVDVINNTCYMNQKSADINAGEFTAIEGKNVVIMNNIAYGRAEKEANSQNGSQHVIWSHNLFYNFSDMLWHDGLINADPRFVAPALNAPPAGFRLQPGSPALGQGVTAVAPPADIAGHPRPAAGPIDLGAFQN